MSCRTLELAGVHTLATTLFTMTQAILAAEVNCTYVAPYVNQLRVHFQPGLVYNHIPSNPVALSDRLDSPTRINSYTSVLRSRNTFNLSKPKPRSSQLVSQARQRSTLWPGCSISPLLRAC